ncbi:MAG: phosphohistidine phosphatase SixA [Planctomycetes bacterium]|nr:phosphohistidine phosphatase SixA [Planctomycetota bacterium]
MELYLIRHADALALGERGVTTDEARPLSEKGETQSEAVARALAKRGVVLDRLCTSPLVRARQTAEILLRVWARPELILETCDDLAPGSKPRKLGKYLLKSAGEKLGLVGHMPDLGEFAGWLLGEKKMQIDFAKAGVAFINCADFPGKGLGDLKWLVTPEWY